MHPALSVIVFTTLSGAGFGLWTWLGLRSALGAPPAAFEPLAWWLLLIAAGIATALGLLASFWHLGKPLRAWRAFSQWRTSWLSREGVLAVACFPVAAALLWLLPGQASAAPTLPLRLLGALLALLALTTVASTAMIYASLPTVPAWRHRLVVPGYLLFALLTGGLPLLMVAGVQSAGPNALLRIALVAIAAALALLKLAYWRAIDRTPLPQTRGEAVGLRDRKVSVFERPHTEGNYITREMGFVFARRHARRLRVLALVGFAALPLAALLLTWWQPAAAGAALAIATVAAAAGAFAERWLFFAQARHLVMLYY